LLEERYMKWPTAVLAASLFAVATAIPSARQTAGKEANALEPTGGRGLTEVHGLKVGHHTLSERPTGCTVILVDGEGVPGGVSQRGGAPGTREIALLAPTNMVDKVNAIVLSGGSAYGLEAATGTMRWLEERKIGWPVGNSGVVPIVPSAILFDLSFGGKPHVRPTADCGYKAADAASTAPVQEGNVGAGAGATVGKIGGYVEHAGSPAGRLQPMKGGLGSAAIRLPSGLVVGAIVAVNSVGDIIDPSTGQVVAGVRTPDGKLGDVRKLIRSGAIGRRGPRAGENTTIGLVATNARLSKVDVNRLAMMADDGFARAINPSHTVGDGDTMFALATGRWEGEANLSTIGALAAEAMAEAIVRAVSKADSLGGVPSAKELGTVPARIR
jgi:L-aminopeptidase/D-esterase-like protein